MLSYSVSLDVEEEDCCSSLSILYLSVFVYISASQTRSKSSTYHRVVVCCKCFINVFGPFEIKGAERRSQDIGLSRYERADY